MFRKNVGDSRLKLCYCKDSILDFLEPITLRHTAIGAVVKSHFDSGLESWCRSQDGFKLFCLILKKFSDFWVTQSLIVFISKKVTRFKSVHLGFFKFSFPNGVQQKFLQV